MLSNENARGCVVKSNKEAGKGYCDIYITTKNGKIGAILEIKLAKDDSLFEKTCNEALKRINARQYDKVFRPIITKTIYKYGIACRQKYCQIKLQE